LGEKTINQQNQECPMYINVAVSIPSAKPFTYAVPEGMENQIAVGKRVLVPFGNRKVTGYIV